MTVLILSEMTVDELVAVVDSGWAPEAEAELASRRSMRHAAVMVANGHMTTVEFDARFNKNHGKGGRFSSGNHENPHPPAPPIAVPNEAHECASFAQRNFPDDFQPDPPPASALRAAEPPYTAAQIDAVRAYQTPGPYAEINGSLRTGVPGSEETQAHIKHLDEIMATHPLRETVIVSRGVDTNAFRGHTSPADAVGHNMVDPGYLSTTLGNGGTRVYNQDEKPRQVEMTVTVPAGTHAIYLAPMADKGSKVAEERELLLDRGAKVLVTSAVYHPEEDLWRVQAQVVV